MDTDYAENVALLKEWGIIYRKAVRWKSSPDEMHEVMSGKKRTAEAALHEAWMTAFACGYTRPRWWQWYRWGEERPPLGLAP